MPSHTSISPEDLARSIGLPTAPVILDVRTTEDFDTDRRLLPTGLRQDARTVADWAGHYAGRTVVVVCHKGFKLSEGVAAWLRHAGARATVLAGGFEGWREAGHPLVRADRLPRRNGQGRIVLVTRERPKIDRIACPWLMRRFVDPEAVVLFVAPTEVEAVADRFSATPFDVDGVAFSHRGALCSFDVMIEEFGLASPALARLADIVRAADTGRLEDCPQAAGILAVSLGLSRLYTDDLAQLEGAMIVYDALYLWCRDAMDETHAWPATRVSA